MKIIHSFIYLIILFALVFFYTGCPPDSVPDPEPTPAPTRLPPINITGLAEVGIIDTGDAAVIVAQGDYLYYTGWYGNDGNLGIIDFSDPLDPVIMGKKAIGCGQGIAVMGGYIFVEMDGKAESEWETGCVASFDVSDPYSIENLDTETQGHYTGCPAFYKDGYFYNCSIDALSIYDVTDPIDIVYVTEIPTTNCYWAAVQDNYLYISEETKMTIYDISTPSLPEYMGEVVNSAGLNVGIAVSGDYAYVGYFTDEIISIINISDPANPVVEKDIALSITSLNCLGEMKVLDHYLLGAAEYGFYVLDISDPVNPVEVDILTTITNYGWGFDISGNYAIVSDDTLYRVIELLSN